MAQPSWKHNDVFPLIGRIIRQAADDEKGYISAHNVASRLLQDTEARPVIEEAQRQSPDTSLGWVATNMVAWFSAVWTQKVESGGQPEWDVIVERVFVDGEWAYRPRD